MVGLIWAHQNRRIQIKWHLRIHPYPNADGQQQRKRRPWWRWLFCFIFLLCLAAVIALVGYEMKTSRLQSQEISRYAATLTYQIEPGPSKQIAFPTTARSTSDSVMC